MKSFCRILLLEFTGFCFSLNAGVLIKKPGCFKVAGKYSHYSAGMAHISVMEGTRSQHIAKIKMSEDPELIRGLKVRVAVGATQSGDPADQVLQSKRSGIEVLSYDSDMYESAWSHVAGKKLGECF